MTSLRISAVLVAVTVPVGVWAIAEAHAGPAPAEQQEQAPAQKREATGDVLQRDMREWMTAWNRLDPQQRQVLLIAGKRVVAEVEGLTPEQKASVLRGLEALAADTTVDYQELPERRREAVQQAIAELRDAYLDLTAEQKTRFLTELAGSLGDLQQHEAQQQPMQPPAQ
jgi:TRAP-type C4-dicarboxylate transport system substrate-binding protein